MPVLKRGISRETCAGSDTLGVHDDRPRSDVPRRVHVGVVRVPASDTLERRLGLAVPPVPMPALGAVLRGISGVDGDQRDSREQRLVAEEGPELEERPTTEPVTCVPAPNRNPIPD